MVYWLVLKDVQGDERCFGPYESEGVARSALGELRRRLLASATHSCRIVCDYT